MTAAPVVAGLVPMSSVDWPGRLAATVFLQGCPWRCTYCQNEEILDPRTPGAVAWEDVLALLHRRRGLLDGVVFSGGEATRQEELLGAAAQVRQLGFAVGLHTAGAYPARLERLLPSVDWVGLDIKALPENYGRVVGLQRGPGPAVAKPGRSAWRSLDLVLTEQARRPEFAFEVRTTVCPSLPDVLGDEGGTEAEGSADDARVSPEELTVRDAAEVARRCRAAGVTRFALQEARSQGVEPGAAARIDAALAVDRGARWRERWDAIVAQVEALGFPHLEIRAA